VTLAKLKELAQTCCVVLVFAVGPISIIAYLLSGVAAVRNTDSSIDRIERKLDAIERGIENQSGDLARIMRNQDLARKENAQ
jgi:prefoldin subunit 5